MKIRTILGMTGAMAALGGGAWALQGCGKAQAQESRGVEAPREVKLMVYKEDFATVQESRPVELKSGRTKIRLDNVSKQLDPMSVMFQWGTGAEHPQVVSNTYDLGVPDGSNLLDRLEGKPVEMLWTSQDGRPRESLKGVLEATSGGGFVIRSGDKLYVNPHGTIVASASGGPVTMPTLSAEVDSSKEGTSNLDVAYQTRGMSWSADYVAELSGEDSIKLECWATVQNHTGVDFPNSKITLVAGSPNRAVANRRYQFDSSGFGGESKEAQTSLDYGVYKARAKAEAVGELYAYKVPAMASIGQEQMNRVRMISSEKVPVKKDYSIALPSVGPYNYGYYEGKQPLHQNAQLAINLTNSEAGGLGMPLPAGAVRVYDTDSGQVAYVGAAEVGDTAKEQRISLTLTKVFDVYSDARLVSSVKAGKRTVRKTFAVILHNEKKSAIDLRLVQSLDGKRRMISESLPSRKLDASNCQWTVHLAPGEKKTLTWVADFSY